jgi:hypothetical protein
MFARRVDWVRAMVYVLLKAEDNAEVATLKARRYLASRLNEKRAAKLIEKAFLELKPLVSGLKGKEQLFMRQQSETSGGINWRQHLAEAGVRGVVDAAVSELFSYFRELF